VAEWPILRQFWQLRVVGTSELVRRAVNSALTMPVGTASVPQPINIITEAIKRPRSVFGVISPKPTVVIVVMAQYTEAGTLLKPFSGPSTTYINVPMTITTSSTKEIKALILRRLLTKASYRSLNSLI